MKPFRAAHTYIAHIRENPSPSLPEWEKLKTVSQFPFPHHNICTLWAGEKGLGYGNEREKKWYLLKLAMQMFLFIWYCDTSLRIR